MLTRYRFRPSWIVTLAFAVLLPALIGLGFWQLDRAAEKTAIRDRVLARSQMDPVDLNRVRPEPQVMEFRRATARGRYRGDLTIYLDNKVLDGTPGYEVVTPLLIGAGADRVILVNRGWVSWGASRETLPAVETPGGKVELRGRLVRPPEEYFSFESGDGTAFQALWQNLDLERYRAVTGLPVAPLVLELAPDDSGGGGLVRQSPEYDDTWIARHRAYAVQWFALALTLVVLYVALNLKKRDAND